MIDANSGLLVVFAVVPALTSGSSEAFEVIIQDYAAMTKQGNDVGLCFLYLHPQLCSHKNSTTH
jgi:hypothetical protein